MSLRGSVNGNMQFKITNNRIRIYAALFCVALISIVPLTAEGQTKRPPSAALRAISVITEPNASVWIDGVSYGKTVENGRLTITTIAPGKRSIRVRAAGFKETSRALTATQKGDVDIPLIKTTDEAELAYQQAEALAGTDREKAVAAYKMAIRLRPAYTEAYIGLARVYSALGQNEEALKAIKDVRKIKPRFAEATVIEGRIFKDGGDDVKAIASFKRAITEGGGFQPEAYTGLGLIYKEKAESDGSGGEFESESQNYTEAARHFAVAIKQLSGAPDALVLYQFLGLVYEQQKKFKEAIAVYREFLRLFPNSPESAAFESFIVQLEKQMNNLN